MDAFDTISDFVQCIHDCWDDGKRVTVVSGLILRRHLISFSEYKKLVKVGVGLFLSGRENNYGKDIPPLYYSSNNFF